MLRNNAISCIVVDDDDISRNIIEKFIEKTEYLDLNHSFSNPEDAIISLQNQNVDLLFLDIEMPQMSGIDLLKNLKNRPYVILITSQKDYAIEAFEYDVVDYILKPFIFARFLKAVQKVKEILSATNISHSTDDLYVKVNTRYIKIPCNDIRFIAAIGDYVEIHTMHKKFTVHSTMKALDKRLSQRDFIRVHRSYIVRLNAISEIEDNTLVIDQKLIPIGKSYRDTLMSCLNVI